MLSKLARLHPEYLGFVMRGTYTVLALLISILLARWLGPAPLGQYYSVLAVILLIGTIVQSGWDSFLVREVAALHEMRRFAELRGLTRMALRIVAAVSLTSAALFILVSWLLADRTILLLFITGAPAVVLLSTSTVRQAITRGMGWPLLGLVCEHLARPSVQLVGLALLASGLIGLQATPVAAMAVFSAAIVASAILAYLLQKPRMTETESDEPAVLPPRSEWLAPFMRTAVIGWAKAINLQIGTIVVSAVASDADTAYFRIALQLSILMSFGLVVATSIHANAFSRLFVRGDFEALERLAARGSLIGGVTALAIALAFIAGGQWLIRELYGESFGAVFTPLLVMVVGQLINAIFGPVGALAIATRNERVAMKVHVLSVVANVLLCALLVPLWGPTGAAVAAALSLSSWNIILYIVLRRRLGIRPHAGAYLYRHTGRRP